ncbi:hypothetical protein JCM33374_g6086 [Metschnikowia sp. JCM 33374]|nr:hypothetical protein JCM33374_g6086 [Metschnikowia sp. JCM 33374]
MQSDSGDAHAQQEIPGDNEAHKNDLITTDDVLDQAIQRIIAQHELEQQQQQQQQQQEQHQQQQQHEQHPQDGPDMPEHSLHSADGGSGETYASTQAEDANQGSGPSTDGQNNHSEASTGPNAPRTSGADPDPELHLGMALGAREGDQQPHAHNVGLEVGVDVNMTESPLLDAAQEKQHLQMIADELKRAADADNAAASPETSTEPPIKAEDESYATSRAQGGTEDVSGDDQGQAQHDIQQIEEIREIREIQNEIEGIDAIHQQPPHQMAHQGNATRPDDTPHETRANDPQTVSLNEQGPSAPHQAHLSEINHENHHDSYPNMNPNMSPNMHPKMHSEMHPQMHSEMHPDIHSERSQHSSENSEISERTAPHIPANSELLATNNAVAAYNALSTQVPHTGSLANAHLAALPLPIIPTSYMPARIQLLVSTLAVLDNLATQLLRVFAVGPYQKIIDLASSPDNAPGAAFRDLTSLFEFTKRLYSEEDPFLTVEHIAPGMWKEGEKTPNMFRNREQTIESTLRKVNLATFLAATLGTIEVGFFHLNESFLNVFCPANDLDPAHSMSNMSADNTNLQSGAGFNIGEKVGKILKPQASLYLDLKTQAYISAIEAGERSSEEILEDILPSNLEEILQERRGTKILSPTEMDFINRCNSRKETLLNYPPDQNLNEEYEWFEFLKDLFEFVSKNMGLLLWGKKGKPTPVRSSRGAAAAAAAAASAAAVAAASAVSANSIGSPAVSASPTPHSDEILQAVSQRPHDESAHQETGSNKGLDDITAALLPSEIQEQQIHLRINPAVNSKGPSRRPWTRQEEKALRHAMELKGTQWSVILELFGQGGRINESLKNRTQVQLKDKARNWKMFFLKSGLAVPHYLQKVTGDLERDDKSRAKQARNKKTAAAPVPTVGKRDGAGAETSAENMEEESRKKRRIEEGH